MQTALLMRFSAGLFSVAPTTCGLHDFAQNRRCQLQWKLVRRNFLLGNPAMRRDVLLIGSWTESFAPKMVAAQTLGRSKAENYGR